MRSLALLLLQLSNAVPARLTHRQPTTKGEERKEDKKEGKRKDGRKNGREGG